MTRHFPTVSRVTAVLLILATPLLATEKRRAVTPHAPAQATLSGTVTDSATGAPVVQVAVSTGGQLLTSTDTKGQFTTKLTPGQSVSLTFVRSGYQTLTTSVSISGDASRTFQMVSLPVTTLRTITGATSQIDTDTIEFGYLAPFSGYMKDTKLNLCTTGGNSFTPDRSEISKIIGPVQLNDAACCSRGAIPAITVNLKSGATSTGGFVDACVGYTVDLIGRDHVTSQPVYFHFSNIAEVDFP
jgi:carboxypeptidase-like protein